MRCHLHSVPTLLPPPGTAVWGGVWLRDVLKEAGEEERVLQPRVFANPLQGGNAWALALKPRQVAATAFSHPGSS